MEGERGDGGSGSLGRGYATAGIMVLNFIVLVVVLNVVLGAAYLVEDHVLSGSEGSAADGRLFRADGAPVDNGQRTAEQLEWFDFAGYRDVEPEYAGQVLTDFYRLAQRGFVYQSWVQFAEPPFDGELLHVDLDEKGFPVRRTWSGGEGAPDREVLRVFTLGGSTTFGYHVSDEHTWPSYLAKILNRRAEEERLPYEIEVVNYGRGYYHPTQEVALLWDLLRSGHRPSLVIFMDGVNLGPPEDEPHFKPQVARSFVRAQHGSDISRAELVAALDWIPMVRFARDANRWLDARRGSPETDGGGPDPEYWESRVTRALRQFRNGHRVARELCRSHGCETLFFLQPNVLYRYNLDLYRMDLPQTFLSRRGPLQRFYRTMAEDSVYVDLSGLFQTWGNGRKAVVDDLHYSPGFNRLLAERVASRIDLDGLPVFEELVVDSAATATARSLVAPEGWLSPPTYGGYARSDGRP